jgi:hypothetical protein
MNGESNGKPPKDTTGIGRLSPIQLAIAGLASALALVILLLVVSVL